MNWQIRSNAINPFISAFILSISSFLANGQEYQYQNFNELNGLPSAETYQITQDSEGFIWIGTDNGVVRFDGEEFALYNSSHGLTDNTVFGFFEDHRGRIWFRTFSGSLSYYNISDRRIHPYAFNKTFLSAFGSNILNDIKVDTLNRLWFSTSMQGPSGIVDSTGQITNTELSPDTAYVFIKQIPTVDTTFAIGITGTPRMLKGVKIENEYYPVSIGTFFRNSPVANCVHWRNKLYISINGSIFRFANNALEVVFATDQSIINMTTDRDDNLWVGYFGAGVQKFTDADLKNGQSIDALQYASVSCTYQDTEGGYWFSTLDRGVFYFPNIAITNLEAEQERTDSKISTVSHGRRGIYTGTYNGKVSLISSENGTEQLLYKSKTPIIAISEDGDNGIWIAAVGGYIYLNRDGKKVTQGVTSGLRDFFRDETGRTFGFNSSGLYHMDVQQGAIHKYFLIRRPTAILTRGDDVYFGSLNGLELWNRDFEPVLKDTFLTRSRISVLHSYRDKIYVGTIGAGLKVLVNGVVENAVDSRALGFENVYDILTLSDKIFVGTEAGLFVGVVDKANQNKTIWRKLNRASGLLADKIANLAILGGRLWVFFDQGISLVPINNTVFSNDHPIPYVKELQVNRKTVGQFPVELAFDENNISVEFGVISYNNRKLSYRSRLKEEEGWNLSDRRNIAHFSLLPGEYRFQVEASLNGIDWHPVGGLSSFEIGRPWWGTWTFRLVIASSLVLIGFVTYRMRLNSVRRKQNYLELINSHQQRLIDSEIQTQERERKRIAKDLHDGVGTSLSSIKLFLSNAFEGNSERQSKMVREIDDNLSEVIAEIKRIVYDLHPPALERYGLQVGLKNLVENINNHNQLRIYFDYYGHKEVSSNVSTTIYRIIQELINNTLKHAKATEVRIHINHFEDEINIMYEDNGIGMVGSRFTGLGLHSIESRIRSLQGKMTWESNHKGTFYNFDVPIA